MSIGCEGPAIGSTDSVHVLIVWPWLPPCSSCAGILCIYSPLVRVAALSRQCTMALTVQKNEYEKPWKINGKLFKQCPKHLHKKRKVVATRTITVTMTSLDISGEAVPTSTGSRRLEGCSRGKSAGVPFCVLWCFVGFLTEARLQLAIEC